MKKFALEVILGICLLACSGENGVDGLDGQDGATVNADSLSEILRDEMWDSWDSLKQETYDSLYGSIFDSVYTDIYTKNAIKNLSASLYSHKETINLAFANQYDLMYRNYTSPLPISVTVQNKCPNSFSISGDIFVSTADESCSERKVLVKVWVDGLSDTGSVTRTVSSGGSETFAPKLLFNAESFLLSSPEQAQYQIRAYALENEREILFYSASEPVTVNPVQVNGVEYVGAENWSWWKGVWVTPGMDSIQNILDDVALKLPGGTLKVYQLYSEDKMISASSKRVVAAIFEVLRDRGIHYIQNESTGNLGQKIKYPIEVLRSRSGICIETTALFASVLEAIGMQAFIVSVPGHAFVGWRVDEDSNTVDFVETTLIGYANSTFDYANESALERYNEEVSAGTFESGESELIDLEKVREFGILPNNIH